MIQKAYTYFPTMTNYALAYMSDPFSIPLFQGELHLPERRDFAGDMVYCASACNFVPFPEHWQDPWGGLPVQHVTRISL
jgi:hypothetical protein